MPGGGGQTSSSQTVNTSQNVNMGPWKTQQPYLGQQFSEAQRLYERGAPQYYPGSTVAPVNHWQSVGLQALADAGSEFGPNNPLNRSADETALKTMQGGFLDPSTNPWLSKTFDAAADPVTRAYQTATAPGTSASFSGGGRYGSPSYRMAVENNERGLGSTLGNLATSIYGGNYQTERDRQQNQVNSVGNLISSKFIAPSAVISAGNQQAGLTQGALSDDVNRWNYNQNADWQNLLRYAQMIQGNYGQSGTTSGTQQSYGTQTQPAGNPLSTILGGALSAASLAGGLGWQPFGSGGLPGGNPLSWVV